MRFHIPRFPYSKRFKHFSLKGGRGRLRKVLAASSFCHHSVANASHRYEVQRSQRGPRAEHQTFTSRSRSIETLSRFFAIPQVASFAALAIRLSVYPNSYCKLMYLFLFRFVTTNNEVRRSRSASTPRAGPHSRKCYPLCPSLLSKTYRRSPCT